MLKRYIISLLVVVVVLGDDNGETVYNAAIDKKVTSDVDDGTNAIFKFLGFKCPKGHRCLPVLECLPCDYGTYKSNEGSDLCENCPNGCTTLRKGAVSWKECVPKCPPGYEESECGKTCTKCRAGYYKSNWKNKLCRKCPSTSNWNRNKVGLKKKSQCYVIAKPECDDYVGNIVIAMDASSAVSEDDFAEQRNAVNDFVGAFNVKQGIDTTRFAVVAYSNDVEDVITFTDYADKSELQSAISGLQRSNGNAANISTALDYVNSNLLFSDYGSDAISYTVIVLTNDNTPNPSQTANSASALKQNVDKVFAVGIGNVDDSELMNIASHEDNIVKVDNTEELTQRLPDLTKDACEFLKADPEDESGEITTVSTPSGVDSCFKEHGTCTLGEYENKTLTALHGTNCERFCQCSHASTELDGSVTHYWVEQSCGQGTLFNEAISVCDHQYNFKCNDAAAPSPATTESPPVIITEPNDDTTSAPGEGPCFEEHGTCTLEEYKDKRVTALHGTNCERFCQCSHASTELDGSVTHYWVEQSCGQATLFNEDISVCDHEYNVECNDTSPTPPSTTGGPPVIVTEPNDEPSNVPDGDRCYAELGDCTLEDFEDRRYSSLQGTNCRYFCQCAHASTLNTGAVTHYWVEHMCPLGTLFDNSLPGCVHEYDMTCSDTGPSTTPISTFNPPTSAPTDSTGCIEADPCSKHDYEVRRLKPLYGTYCEQFCHCAHQEGSAGTNVTYYWEVQTCPVGTLFDESLPTPVCNHEFNVVCEDTLIRK